ncbi:MAG: M23 family metallopeptidase, partial [Ruminococcus sp.]|nr:M23 family metallopeptidase [Ruminococcus sp.]
EETVPEETKPASSSTNTSSSSSGFIWPFPHTHNITSYMEWRWGRMHNGLDIAGGDDYGQPFYAAASGNVIWSGNDGGGYGNYVMIDHGNGYMTVYGHASALACNTGDYVNQGDLIGYVGDTGNATGPHLHFEIRLNDEYMNPLDYVS